MKILVTGPSSMIGREVIKSLKKRGTYDIYPVYHEDCDLTNQQDTDNIFNKICPDYVIHLAGFNGGIEFNRLYPEQIFEKTSRMAINVLSACRMIKPKKILSVLPSCSYPDTSNEILEEKDLWNGLPNKSVDCHGLSKRILHAYSLQLRKKNINAICCVLTNCFGPFDKFDKQRAKVVGSLIKKFVDAEEGDLEVVDCWGTGAPLREFMFAPDAGEAIVQALEHYERETPLNIGSNIEVSIKELVECIVKVVGYKGECNWMTDKQDGQMRKLLDTKTMREKLKVPITPLEDGITETVNWYRNKVAEGELV